MAGGDPAATPGGASPAPPPPAPASAAAAAHPLPFRLVPDAPTKWDPASATVTLNVRLDGCIVPSEAAEQGARVSYSHAVVLDDFIDDATRQQLLEFLLRGPPDGGDSPADGAARQQQARAAAEGEALLPSRSDRWERRTADMAGGAPTWGVTPRVLRQLESGALPALREVGARLRRLYPECDVAHLPSEAIQLGDGEPQQGPQRGQQQGSGEPQQDVRQDAPQREQRGAEPPAKRARPAPPAADCACFVANAAVAGDSFRFHVDADPTSFPDGSPWHAAYGDYFNGEPGRPLLVSLLLYLNPEWRREWGADTLLLDRQTDTGVFVAPRPCRALLFDQDVLHRVSPPAPAAGATPRFSLVWKLALLPRRRGQALCLARPEWGPPASFGSAARVDAVKRRLAAEARAGGARGA